MDFLADFFVQNFAGCVWLAVILVAMCPTLESKIAIPLAMNTAMWGSSTLSPFIAFLLASLGSILPSYLIILLSRKCKNKATGFISSGIFRKYTIKGSSFENKSSEIKKYLCLAGFVSIPLPLTGVWTGSLIAGMTNLKLNYAFLSISIGGLISAGAMTLLCTIFTNSISYIFIISLIIVILFLFVDLFLSIYKHKKIKSTQ